jgi:hypothetical protein
MLKRRKGYTLLLLLVLTGLAGRLSTTTITNKERRLIIDKLKESKMAVLKSVTGLSEKQLNFKISADKWSIKECLLHITLDENSLWNRADAALKKPADRQKKKETKLNDQEVLSILTTGEQKKQVLENFKLEKPQWKTSKEALAAFKDKRNELIKFAKTSTDDMRNHVLQMPIGQIDTYQMILYISAHTKYHIAQIEEIKADPAFPK